MNEHYRIQGAYQNHDGTWFGAPVWDLAIILSEIASEWLGSQYDILNAAIEGLNSWPLGFEFIAPYVHTIDVKDACRQKRDTGWQLNYVPLAKGNVEFGQFFQLLNKCKLEVPFSMHFEYDLGGAEVGAHHLSIPADKVITAMKTDLRALKNIMIRHQSK